MEGCGEQWAAAVCGGRLDSWIAEGMRVACSADLAVGEMA